MVSVLAMLACDASAVGVCAADRVWTRSECEAAARRPQKLTGKASFDLYANTCCAAYDCRGLVAQGGGGEDDDRARSTTVRRPYPESCADLAMGRIVFVVLVLFCVGCLLRCLCGCIRRPKPPPKEVKWHPVKRVTEESSKKP